MGARDEEDPSMQAWHLRERLYRKDINAWNPGRKLGSAERRTLPSRFLSFSSCRDSLSPQCDDRVCTTTLRYRKIRSRWLEKSRPTIKQDNNFLRAWKQCCSSKNSVKKCGIAYFYPELKKYTPLFSKSNHVDKKEITMSNVHPNQIVINYQK